MDVPHLFVTLCVEAYQFLTCRSAKGFLKVGIQASPRSISLVCDAVACIQALRTIRCLVLAVKMLKGVSEATGDAMLVVKGDGALDGIVADHVAVGQVFGNNARSWLIFLRDIVYIAGGIVRSCVRASNVIETRGAGDLDLRTTKLSVV